MSKHRLEHLVSIDVTLCPIMRTDDVRPMDTDDLISITDAARQLQAGRATLYRALDDGRLNGVEVAGRTVIVQDEKWEAFEPKERGTRSPNYRKSDGDE